MEENETAPPENSVERARRLSQLQRGQLEPESVAAGVTSEQRTGAADEAEAPPGGQLAGDVGDPPQAVGPPAATADHTPTQEMTRSQRLQLERAAAAEAEWATQAQGMAEQQRAGETEHAEATGTAKAPRADVDSARIVEELQMSSSTHAPAPGRMNRPSPVAAAVGVLAAVALIVSLLGPTWVALVGTYEVDFGALKTETSLGSAPGIQHAYFGYLGVALVIVVIIVLLAAVLVPVPIVSRLGRFVVIVLSLLGLVLTLLVVTQLDNQDPGGSFVKHFGWIRLGGYLHVVGWVLAIAAVVLASRARARKS
ncbi:MAG: hypothetical protein ABR604_01875 [Jatrophihabitantaceae bacterium]